MNREDIINNLSKDLMLDEKLIIDYFDFLDNLGLIGMNEVVAYLQGYDDSLSSNQASFIALSWSDNLDKNLIQNCNKNNDEEVRMSYTEGDQVRYNPTGQLGIIKLVDEENRSYRIDIDGIVYEASEDEIS